MLFLDDLRVSGYEFKLFPRSLAKIFRQYYASKNRSHSKISISIAHWTLQLNYANCHKTDQKQVCNLRLSFHSPNSKENKQSYLALRDVIHTKGLFSDIIEHKAIVKLFFVYGKIVVKRIDLIFHVEKTDKFDWNKSIGWPCWLKNISQNAIKGKRIGNSICLRCWKDFVVKFIYLFAFTFWLLWIRLGCETFY